MPMNPREEGFAWPEETEIRNASGSKMTIKPAILRAHAADAANDRERECYRLYETPMGLLSELEIKYWQTGGFQAVQELIRAYKNVFNAHGKDELPLETVLNALRNRDYSDIQIEVVVGWLIRGQYVRFDSDALTIGKLK